MGRQLKYSLVFRRKIHLMVYFVIEIALVLWTGTVAVTATAPAEQTPPFSYPNGRFGFGLTGSASVAQRYGWPTYLNAGWYWDWSARGATQLPPLHYIQTVRLRPIKDNNGVQIGYTTAPITTSLRAVIAKQPGATWFIGSEPDCTLMDNMLSEWYARAYHDLYYFIKAADPTAKIAAGNIVQPTPQRLKYLERVLAAYRAYYNEPLPADVWSIHNYILCETCYPTPAPGEPPWGWGACFVPDWPDRESSRSIATFYSVYDHWNMNIFTQRIRTFRQWMYDNGYRNHPLLIPEYGVLFYEGLVYSGSIYDIKSREFMYAGFDWMQTAGDPLIGYRPDGGRLVQGWAWYSLDHGDYPGGTLFDPLTLQPTVMGRDYAAYTARITPTVDLLVLDTHVSTPVAATGTSVTATVAFTIANAGNLASGPTIVAKVIGNSPLTPTHYAVVGETVLRRLACCGDHESATVTWPGYVVGMPYDFYITALDVDLHVERVWTPLLYNVTTPITAMLYASLRNDGFSALGEPLTVTFYENNAALTPIGRLAVQGLGCCGHQQHVSMPWAERNSGLYSFCTTAQTAYLQTKPVCASLWVNPPYMLYLPLTIRDQ